MPTIAITPVAKPRMTRSDKWKKRQCVLVYRAFCDELRLKLKHLPVPLVVTFGLPMPESWSQAKRFKMAGQPHMQKPDIDNLVKALLDAMLDDDSHVWKITATKVWSNQGFISVEHPETAE
jgi:Holliday junction resolvase RusA-like endonuclease